MGGFVTDELVLRVQMRKDSWEISFKWRHPPQSGFAQGGAALAGEGGGMLLRYCGGHDN